MKQLYLLILLGSACAAGAAAPSIDLSKLPPPAAQKGVTFAKDIQPLLQASCVRCHGEERPKSGLRLTSLEGVLKGSKDGEVIKPGASDKSKLVIAISQLDPHLTMPPRPRGPRGGPGAAPGAPGAVPNAPDPKPPAGDGNPGAAAPGGPGGGPGGPGRGPGGPPPKPLTPEQVGLVRAWIDQGAK
jgi:hypothetical protein